MMLVYGDTLMKATENPESSRSGTPKSTQNTQERTFKDRPEEWGSSSVVEGLSCPRMCDSLLDPKHHENREKTEVGRQPPGVEGRCEASFVGINIWSLLILARKCWNLNMCQQYRKKGE